VRKFDGRIEKLEKILVDRLGDEEEEEAKKSLDQFREMAPTWLKEIYAMFFTLMTEFDDVLRARNPGEKRTLDSSLPWKEDHWSSFSFIQDEVKAAIEIFPPDELKRVDRSRVKVEFLKVVSESTLANQIKDDLLKLLGNPHGNSHNKFRKVWGLPPLEAEAGGRWKFVSGRWSYHDGIVPKRD